MKKLLVLAMLVAAANAIAQSDPNPNGIGFYFDEGGVSNYLATAAPYTVVNAYLIATRITEPSGIIGWEAEIAVTPSPVVAPSYTTNGGINVLTAPVFQVGLGAALPYAPAIKLLTVGVLNFGTPFTLAVGPCTPSSFYGMSPGYAAGNNPERLVGLTPASNVPLPGRLNFFTVAGFMTPAPPPPITAFTVGVIVTCNALTDSGNQLGTHSGALDTFDGDYDVPEAPHSPSTYLSGFFSHPDWALPIGEAFAVDMRAPYDLNGDLKSWPFSVVTDQIGTVTLTFNPSFPPSTSYDIMVEDTATGVMTSIYPALTYSYASSGTGRRNLVLHVGHTYPVPDLTPPTRSVAAGWSMLGMPLVPAAGSEAVSDVLFDDINGYAWVYAYAGSAGYDLCVASRLLHVGEGLWVANLQNFTWDMQGSRNTGTIDVPLAEGWNLLGYPLWFTLPLEKVHVICQGASYTYAEALAANLIAGNVYGWDTAAAHYTSSVSLDAWNGYWVAAYRPDVSLRFDYRYFYDVTKGGLVSKADLPPSVATEGDWRLPVLLTDKAGVTAQIVLGTCPFSTDAFDAAWDLPTPPTSPAGPRPDLAILHPEWLVPTGSGFATDLRAAENSSQTWRTRITLPRVGTATLNWDGAHLPNEVDLNVYLPSQNRVVVRSMQSQTAVTLEVPADGLIVEFRTQDQVTGVPSARAGDLGLRCVPNPFNPFTELRFALPTAGRAEVRLFDGRGREVRRLGGVLLAAGPQVLRWDGRDSTGANLASGIYFARVYLDGLGVGHAVKMSLLK